MDSKNLKMLIRAISQIQPKLVSNCRHISKITELKYLNERSFAYELYRQWQNIVEQNEDSLVINAEITKKYEDKIFLSKLYEIFGLTKKNKPHRFFYPDLVYHHSQFDSDKQEVICEIKTMDGVYDKNSTKLGQDLKKLAAYMTEGILLYHPFKIGVFILIGGSFSEIKKRYENDQLVNNKAKEIYCITYNIKQKKDDAFDQEIECMSLFDVLNKTNN